MRNGERQLDELDAASVVIRRTPSSFAQLRGFTVIVDRDPVKEVDNGRSVQINLTPGRYEVRMKFGWWCSSPTVSLEVRNGEQKALVCRSGYGTLWDPFFRPRKCIDLVPGEDALPPQQSIGQEARSPLNATSRPTAEP
jgi:hypothetical protein